MYEEDDMYVDQAQEALEDEIGAQYGDPSHCPIHGETTSDAFGLHSTSCSQCEGEGEEEARMWDYSSENPHRKHCGLETYISRGWDWGQYATCQDVYEDIPF